MMPWQDDCGLVTLPTGPRVRGRRSSDKVSSADFALILGDSSPPDRPYRHIRWRDFWIPNDRVQALDALHKLSAARTTASASRLSAAAASAAQELRWPRWQSWTAFRRIMPWLGFAANTTHALLRHPGNDAGSEKSADPNWAVFRQLSDETPVGASVPRPSCGAAFTAPSSAPASGSGRPSDRGGD